MKGFSGTMGQGLGIAAAMSALLYGVLLWLGPRYALTVPVAERPLLVVIGLYTAAGGVYLVALRLAVKLPSSRRLALWIVGTSLLYRGLLLPTPPFQEIDIYRYLWDGAVTARGLDPYVVAPQEVVTAIQRHDGALGEQGNSPVAVRVRLAQENEATETILRTIHYAELPSPYPPLSQTVFAVADLTTGNAWSATGRLRWLKLWLTAFDVGTLLLLLRLLVLTGMPIGWALAYGWCPLVLKEFAGSGHLDTIAIFFTTAALVVAAELFAVPNSGTRRASLMGIGSAGLLGLGVAAKLYPVVLAPLLALTLLRRLGARVTFSATLLFLLIVAFGLLPMFLPSSSPIAELSSAIDPAAVALPPPPQEERALPRVQGKIAGLAAFFDRWEMNDLAFMLVLENLRSQKGRPEAERPWFDLTPDAWSRGWWGNERMAFQLTRALTVLLFAVIAIGFAVRVSRPDTALHDWLDAAFLTLAWFWLLSPTQNPWYWCWAVPLLPFARSWVWRGVAVVVMAYYFRFWLETDFPEPGFAGTPYDGKYFFYYVVAVLEHGPLLAWLAIEACWTRSHGNAPVCRC